MAPIQAYHYKNGRKEQIVSSYGDRDPRVTVVRFHTEDCIPDGTCELNECLYREETDEEYEQRIFDDFNRSQDGIDFPTPLYPKRNKTDK